MEIQNILHKGELRLSNGGAEEAIELYDTALNHDRNCFNAWLGKGTGLKLLKRYQEALDCYERALIVNNDSMVAKFLSGHLRHKLYHKDEV